MKLIDHDLNKNISEVEEFHQWLNEFGKPIKQLQREVYGINSIIDESIQNVKALFQEPLAAFHDVLTAISSPPNIYDSERTTEIRQKLHEIGSTIISRIDTAFHKMSWELLVVETYLLQEGWCISPDRITLTETRSICHAICEGKELKPYIISYIKERIKADLYNLEQEFIEKWPKRERFFQAAFKAHHEGLYELSIPVFLIQIDGISSELFKQSVYQVSERSGREKTKQEILRYLAKEQSKESQMFWFFILQLLLQDDPIREQMNDKKFRKKKRKGKYHLNRHAVIHGWDLDYATEDNSLCAIARLDYFNGVRDKFYDAESEMSNKRLPESDIEELFRFIESSLEKFSQEYKEGNSN